MCLKLDLFQIVERLQERGGFGQVTELLVLGVQAAGHYHFMGHAISLANTDEHYLALAEEYLGVDRMQDVMTILFDELQSDVEATERRLIAFAEMHPELRSDIHDELLRRLDPDSGEDDTEALAAAGLIYWTATD